MLTDAALVCDTYEGVEVGGPLYGGIDSEKNNVGFLIRVPDLLLIETTLWLNVAEVLQKK